MRAPLVLAALMLLPLVGCGGAVAPAPKAGAPPLEFSVRKSQIPTKGMVVGIRNASDATLEEFIVYVEAEGEEGKRSYRVDAPLRPEDSITVGWMELDGWELKAGDRLTVKCKQYTGSAEYTVPDD